MDTENGVLEWCTEWSAGVLECWPSLMLNNAGPEVGIPMGATMDIENWVLEGGWRRVLAENGCAQLHAFTRIYTLLHKISGGNVTSDEIRASRQDLPVR